MLWLLLVGVVLAAAAYLTDQAATTAVERRVARAVAEATRGDAEVTLHGWPVAARMVAGSIPRVEVTVRNADLPDAPARLRTLEATLYDVEVDLRGDPYVRSARDGRVLAAFDDVEVPDARLRSLRLTLPSVSGSLHGLEDPAVPLVVGSPGGRFEAELTDQDVTAMLGVPQLHVELREDHVRLTAGPVWVDATAEVEAGAILLRPRQPLLAFVLRDVGPLRIRPRLPPTAVLTDIDIRAGALRLFGAVDRLEIPAASG